MPLSVQLWEPRQARPLAGGEREAARAVAQSVAYEIPLLLAVLSIALTVYLAYALLRPERF